MKLDLILRNAQILTMDPARPKAKSIGFLHGRIAGLDEDLDGLNANDVVDLGGRTVVPGFIDAHCHTTWFGLGLIEPSVDACANFPELFDELRREASQVPAGEWLVVSGFNHRKFDGRFPDLAGLDAATGNVPLFLRHNSGHLAVVNTAALRMAGLYTPGTFDPAGGTVVRGNDGQPTGVIEETAQEAFQALFQPRPLARLIEAVDEATKVYATQGITSFTDAGIGGGWIGQSSVELAAFQHAEANGQLAARAQLMPVLDVLHRLAGHPADGLGTGLDLGIHSGFGSEMLSLGPVKVFLDGSLLGETAAMSEPFCSHGSGHGGAGYFQSDPSELRQAIEDAYRSGWAIAAHAIGDRAVDLALDIFEDLQGRYGRQPLPNRIEHASVTRPDQLPKLARAGIAVTPQASFFHDGGDGMSASLGPKRVSCNFKLTIDGILD